MHTRTIPLSKAVAAGCGLRAGRRIALGVLCGIAVCRLACISNPAYPGSPLDPPENPPEGVLTRSIVADTGMVLYTNVLWGTGSNRWEYGDLLLKYLSNGNSRMLVEDAAFNSSFSPDGRRVAYPDRIRMKLCVIGVDGSGRREVASFAGSKLTVTWAGNGYIYWTESDHAIRRVRPDGTGNSVVFESDSGIEEGIVSQDGRYAAWTQGGTTGKHRVYAGDLESDSSWFVDYGCQGTISADGRFVAHNILGHTHALVWLRETGTLFRTIETPYRTFNLHRWSRHHARCLLYTIDYYPPRGHAYDLVEDTAYYVCDGYPWDYYPAEFHPADTNEETPWPDEPEFDALDFKIVSPSPGDTFSVGDTLLINWYAIEGPENAVIEISADAGISWVTITSSAIGRDSGAWGHFEWVVPASVTLENTSTTIELPGASLLLRIHDYDGEFAGVTDGEFFVAE
ncbi:MAG: hypothetical protein GF418_15815 [Chitinivibrionales bacterium]|nr:hypothetical protein [Chitinivibrionales bacterium]MBD3397089.1 hypothetical protein [Chitinivibrionales bacterium]